MAQNLVLDPEQAVAHPSQPKTLPLEEALEQVRRDSRHEADAYLEETVVPHGGE